MQYKEFDGTLSLKGKVAVVTGAAMGIGHAIAEAYAQQGAKVVMVDMSADIVGIAGDVAKKFDVQTLPVQADLTAGGACQDVVDKAVAAYGTVDILANVAGIVRLDNAEDISEDDFDKTMAVNCKAVFMMSQKVANVMIKNGGGKIVNMASQAGFIALDKHVAYTASKAAVIGITKVTAYEWAEFGINVNAVSPTVVLTELGKKAWSGEVGENMKKQIPAGRFAMPDEIAAATLFLSSDAANMITGENLVIDGGFTIK